MFHFDQSLIHHTHAGDSIKYSVHQCRNRTINEFQNNAQLKFDHKNSHLRCCKRPTLKKLLRKLQAVLQPSLLRVRHVYWARNVTWSSGSHYYLNWRDVTALKKRSWKRNAFCSFWFLDDKKRLVGNSFRRRNFLI